MTFGDSAPSTDHWNLAAVEVKGSGTQAAALDQNVSANRSVTSSAVTAPPLTTSSTSQFTEETVAFISTSGPNGSAQSVTGVTGGGLSWSRAAQANTQRGTAEIWIARGGVTNAMISATLQVPTADAAITVSGFSNSFSIGQAWSGNGASGAPNLSISTTTSNTLVWGVGEDPDAATTRTPNSGQAVVNQFRDGATPATFWTQKVSASISKSGTAINFGDSAPTADHWNLAAIQVNPYNSNTPAPDGTVSANRSLAAATVSTPTFSTTAPNELLVATG